MSQRMFEWLFSSPLVTGLLWLRRRLVCEFGYSTSFQGYDIICISRTDHRRSGFAREYYGSVFSSIQIEIQVVPDSEHCVL